MKKFLVPFIFLFFCCTLSYADRIYKCIDERGNIKYTTTSRPGCKLLSGSVEKGLSPQLPTKEAAESTSRSRHSEENPIFRERILYPLKWGMSVDSFKSSYLRADEVTKSMSTVDSNEYFQDLGLPFYGHISNTGFRFGEQGLENIIISYLFRTKDRRLYQSDILNISKQILQKLIQAYGKPTYSYPWNGQMFNYMWLGTITYVQFAWVGGDSWGIQFRSMELDPQIKILMKHLKGG